MPHNHKPLVTIYYCTELWAEHVSKFSLAAHACADGPVPELGEKETAHRESRIKSVAIAQVHDDVILHAVVCWVF